MNASWYALRVKPNREQVVTRRLENKKIEVFLPLFRVNPKNPRAAKLKPYFPGYLFVRTDLETIGANTFNWMPGALSLVSFDGVPASVPDKLILEIREQIARIEAEGGLTFVDLEPGDKVRIIEGPFAGYEAIFDMRLPGKDRVQVLLAFLSEYPQTVTLDETNIKKIKKNN